MLISRDHFLSVTVIAVHPHVQFSPYTVLDCAAAGVHKALISQTTPFPAPNPTSPKLLADHELTQSPSNL